MSRLPRVTPTVSTVWMGVVSIAFYVGLTLVSENVLQDSIVATGMLSEPALPFSRGAVGMIHSPSTTSVRFIAATFSRR